MAPPKKSKKVKRKLKELTTNCSSDSFSNSEIRQSELKAAFDEDWWYSFLSKNSGSNIPREEEEAFKHFFRVSKATFEYICSLVREDLISRPPSGLINIEGRLLSVEKQVAIAMRRLASGESQVSVGASFGVGQSTVSQVTWRFVESMEDRARHHMRWPDADKLNHIKRKFESKYGLANCCGAIDATHIIMTLPALESSDDWCDEEKNYSMYLQAIVDHDLRFLDIVTGLPGSMTNHRLLKFSGFYKLCENGRRLSEEKDGIREFIVGDTAFPLLPWLMTPYQGKHLSDSMVKFNSKHKEVKMLASNALSQLKGAWRILHKVMWRPDKHKLPSIILVCCLLHNIVIDKGDKLQYDVALLDHHDSGYKQQICQHVDPCGQATREEITRLLS